jgi:hypothetical protein
MGNTNEYWKLLRPPIKHNKASERRQTYVIYGYCNKSRHSKVCCDLNLNNSNNKLKDKNEVTINGILVQIGGGVGNESGNERGHGKTNKFGSIIYRCFTTIPLNIKSTTILIRMQLK